MTSISKTILIADDQEDLTWSISRSLRKENQHYDIICVNSGDEALKFLKRIPFDLLITDIRMPGQDGFMLLGYVKKHFPKMKVIVMSAWYGSEIKELVAKTREMNYIEKPFEIGDLKKTINKALLGSDSNRYQGRLIDLSVKDIIRHNCQNRFDGSLNIRNGKESGIIHFHAGEVIHAQVGKMEGDRAFRDVLNWNNCEYDTIFTTPPIKKTVSDDWKIVLNKFDSNV